MKHTARRAASHKKQKNMIERLKNLLQDFNPHSKILIAAIFVISFIFLILITIALRIGQNTQTRTSQNTPTPTFIPDQEFVQGQINVKFRDDLTDQQINQLLREYNARIKSTISGINVKVVEVPIGKENEIRQQLRQEGAVEYAELDHIIRGTFIPNDTHFGLQYGLRNTGQTIVGSPGTTNADIHIERAWDVTKGDGVVVAVLDSGLDMSHPEFSGKVVLQKTFITSSVDDGYGHGTHTAGIVAANTNNNQGIAGVCPDCKLMIGKVLNDNNQGSESTVASGVTWAADNNAKVLNLSLGTYDDVIVLKNAISYAWNKNVVIVASAGNNNTTRKNYPAGYDNVISVGATDNKDQKADFSNHGSWVKVTAPGKNILSTLPTKQNALKITNYGYLSGTSMSGPMVAGIAGLVWAHGKYATSNQAVVDRILSTVDPIAGTGTYWQKGRVNAASALGAVGPVPSISPSLVPPVSVVVPSVSVAPSIVPSPSNFVPSFVCAGSPNAVCYPSTTVAPPGPSNPNPSVSQGPSVTVAPSVIPSIGPEPCLNPQDPGFVQQILNWVQKVRQTIMDYIYAVLGNPQGPRPPQPVIIPPCIQR